MKVKEAKEVVVAKISTRQAVTVAVISLLSAIAVASISNFDKLVSKNNEVSEEVGYYRGRAGMVEHAFHEAEETLQSQSDLARKSGELEASIRLKELADKVRTQKDKFQERHKKHLEAIQNGKRLNASEIKTEANEAIFKLNVELYISEPSVGKRDDLRRIKLSQEVRRLLQGVAARSYTAASKDFQVIPLYGKQRNTQNQEQVCQLNKIENPVKAGAGALTSVGVVKDSPAPINP